MLTHFIDGPARRQVKDVEPLFPGEVFHVAKPVKPFSLLKTDDTGAYITIHKVDYRLVAIGPHAQFLSCRKELWA